VPAPPRSASLTLHYQHSLAEIILGIEGISALAHAMGVAQPNERNEGTQLAVTILDCEATLDPMIGKTKAQPARRKKPRGEQLLDRIDKNPNDREAWNELARGSRIRRKKKKQTR
jgi:hypothetical protein